MTADRPARPARRALDDLSLPIDRDDLDERLIALGLGDIEDRLAALDAYESLPAESNRLYTTYIDLRAGLRWKARRSTGRRPARTSRCRSRMAPPGCSSSPTAT